MDIFRAERSNSNVDVYHCNWIIIIISSQPTNFLLQMTNATGKGSFPNHKRPFAICNWSNFICKWLFPFCKPRLANGKWQFFICQPPMPFKNLHVHKRSANFHFVSAVANISHQFLFGHRRFHCTPLFFKKQPIQSSLHHFGLEKDTCCSKKGIVTGNSRGERLQIANHQLLIVYNHDESRSLTAIPRQLLHIAFGPT